jgi:predicted phage terminase large subunit-like protein
MNLLTKEEVKQYLALLEALPPNSPEIAKVWALLKADKQERCKHNFMPFVREMWSAFIPGKHHQIMAEAFERVASGDLKRLIINMPPRHTKSEFASYLFPAWFLGKFPEKKIIQTAHTAELATGFGRKVRNLVNTPDYQAVFPTKLSADSKAAGRWNTNKGGDYFAIGVGGAVTGKGADVLIIDDPHSEQEAMQGTPQVYDRVYEWYSSGPRQRLQPGGAIVIVMCMTGDTRVLRADGSETYLRDIKPGDEVATYDENTITTSKVLNHRSSGIDSVFTLHTQSGRILRANRKHPFLVDAKGGRKWIRLEELKLGMCLVATKDATGPLDHKRNPDYARLAKLKSHTTKSTPTRLMSLWDTTVNYGAQLASTALNQPRSKTYARPTITKLVGRLGIRGRITPLSIVEINGLNTVTGLLKNILTGFSGIKTGFVQCVNSLLQNIIPAPIGMVSCVSTTATTQGLSVGYFATTVTSQWGMQKPQRQPMPLLYTSDFTLDPIVSITSSGEEEVFDIEVERTGNFIANGVVSHNTRWSKKDLTGQIVDSSLKRELDEWEVIELPALMPSGNPLWPEFWKKEELEAIRDELPVGKWNAQYQQNPTSEEGAIIKRDMWQIWEKERAPTCEYIIQSWDTAFEKNNRADYSACTTWGVFYKDKDGTQAPCIILLDAFKQRLEFPELKKKALEFYKEWNPDTLIVEKKAAGAPLIYEMRRMGIPVSEYTPSRGNDKVARVNAISDLFASGTVWRPETRWAEEVVEELASFPNGDNDDLVDSTSQALLRFRQGGFISLDSDEPDEEKRFKRRRAYY